MTEIYRYIKGYVKIRVSGDLAERFINILVAESVSVWGIMKIGDGIVLCLSSRDYLRLVRIRHSFVTDIRIKLLEKKGLPFFIKGYSLRLGIPIGVVLFIAINIFMSNFIWSIEVIGNAKISKEEIISACNELDINIGDSRKSIDTYNAKQELAIRFDDIAWASLNIEGSRLTVNLSEATDNKKKDEIPQNIVASYDGVVKKIEIIKGSKNVSVNQAVRRGDVLVSGIIENPLNIHFVAADGEIIAETERIFTMKIAKNYTYKQTDKVTQTKNVLELFWIKAPLYLSGVDFESSSYITKNNLKLFGTELPIGITSRVFFKINNKQINTNADIAKNIALAEVAEEIRKLDVDRVLSVNCSIEESKNEYIVTVNLTCLENICEFRDIN